MKKIITAALICITSVGIMIAALLFSGNRANQQDFVPPPFDPNAATGTPSVPELIDWCEVNAQVFNVYICGVFEPVKDCVDVWFYNPAENSVWLKLRFLDMDGQILGETGLIRPDEYVQSVMLSSVPKPGTKVLLKLMAYEPESYHSAGSAILETLVQSSSKH